MKAMEVEEISRIFDNVTARDITEIHFKSKKNPSIKFETEKEVLNKKFSALIMSESCF